MKPLNRMLAGAIALAAIAGLTASASQAAYLYWNKFEVKHSSERVCMSFANSAARGAQLQAIRVSGLEVAGSRDGVYVSMTCVGRSANARAIGVVMTIGDNQNTTISVRDMVSQKFQSVICFDEC